MDLDSRLLELQQAKSTMSGISKERFGLLFDGGSFIEIDSLASYDDASCNCFAAYGAVNGNPVYAFSQDSSVDSGAVSEVHAAKIKKVFDLAAKTGTPVVGIYDSKGGALAKGNSTLSAYGDILVSANNISGVVPHISIILGSCGGSMAMVAMAADIVIMSDKARMFLSSPNAILAAGQNPDRVGTAAAMSEAGAVTTVAADSSEAIRSAREVISYLPLNNMDIAPPYEPVPPSKNPSELVAYSKNSSNPDYKHVIDCCLDSGSAYEFYSGYGNEVFTALARIDGNTCGIVYIKDSITSMGANKSARMMSFCNIFNIPVITFVDTPGFEPSAEDELTDGLREAARLSQVYAEATNPKISVIIGKAYGAAYVALAGKGACVDLAYAWSGAEIGMINPQAAIQILWTDRLAELDDPINQKQELAEEYRLTECSALNAARYGLVEDVIEPSMTRDVLICALDMLAGKRVNKLPKKHSNIPM